VVLPGSAFPGRLCQNEERKKEKLGECCSSKDKKWNRHPLRLSVMKCKSPPLHLLSASVGRISSSPDTGWYFDLACRWKYGLETFLGKLKRTP